MAVIPSYTGFAATPSLGSSFLGGARIAQQGREADADRQLKRQQLAQEAQSDSARLAQAAASDAQRIQLAREQLAQRQVENQMELEATQKMVEQKALQQAQEANIEAAYKNTQLGLQERRLKGVEAITKMRLEQAAQGFAKEQAYERRRQELMAGGGLDERQASEQAMREVGFGQAGFARAFAGQDKPPPMDTIREKIPAVDAVSGSPAESRSLLGIDWLRKDKPAVESVAGRGEQTITRRIQQGLTVPSSLSNTNSSRRLKFNPKTGRLE